MPKIKPIWREFEELIARIEQTLAGQSVEVKSPDRVPSLSTGRKREVDASIRTKIGSTNILVTIECRKRSTTQDVTWIEQLSTKRNAIGAAKTIAVSSTKFSAEAIDTAKRCGIDLRLLSEIDSSDIKNWFLPKAVIHIYPTAVLAGAPKLGFKKVDISRLVEAKLSFSTISSQYINDKGEIFSFGELLDQVNTLAKVFEKIPQDDRTYRKAFSVSFNEPLFLIAPIGNIRLDKVDYELDMRWKYEALPIEHAQVSSYQTGDPDEDMVPFTRIEVVSKEAPQNIRFGIQFENGSDEVSITLQLIPKAS